MKKKLLVIPVLTLITLWSASFGTSRSEASCSGDACGCQSDYEGCLWFCPPQPQTGWYQCQVACTRAYSRCGIACCGDF